MPSLRKIGRVVVDFVAGTDKFKAEVREAEQEVKKSADRMEGHTNRIDAFFGKIGAKAEKSTAGIRKFAGAMSGIVGVATAVASAVLAVVGAMAALVKILSNARTEWLEYRKEQIEVAKRMRETANLARELDQSLGQAADSQAVTAAKDKLRELRLEIEGFENPSLDRTIVRFLGYTRRLAGLVDTATLSAEKVGQLKFELEALEGALKKSGASAEEATGPTEEQARALERLADAIDKVNRRDLSPADKIRAEAQDQIKELTDLINSLTAEQADSVGRQYLDAIDAIEEGAKKAIQALKDEEMAAVEAVAARRAQLQQQYYDERARLEQQTADQARAAFRSIIDEFGGEAHTQKNLVLAIERLGDVLALNGSTIRG